jgi:hypothetical protein
VSQRPHAAHDLEKELVLLFVRYQQGQYRELLWITTRRDDCPMSL